MNNLKKYVCEFFGTMVLVLVACGIAVATGANVIATSLGFGLVIVAMAYSIGNVSGCHINPAVSLAMLINKKITCKEFLGYLISQFLGALVGSLLLAFFVGGFDTLGANTVNVAVYESNVLNYGVAIVVEFLLTLIFVFVILGVTSKNHNKAVSGIVIGLTLTLVHLIGIFFTGTSVNPARSFGPAVVQAFSGDLTALKDLAVFIFAPFGGAAVAAVLYKVLLARASEEQ